MAHDHMFPGVRDGGHRHLHHHFRNVGEKGLHGQELAQLPVALSPLHGALRTAEVVGIQELHHFLIILRTRVSY